MERTKNQANLFQTHLEQQRKQWCASLPDHKGTSAKSTALSDVCPEHMIEVNWRVVGSDGKSIAANSQTEDDKLAEAEK